MKRVFLLTASAFLVLFQYSCGNSQQPGNEQPKFPTDATATKPASAAMIAGETVYKRTCIACHQANGEGLAGTFPPLAKSDFITDKERTIAQVIHGYTGELTVNGQKYNNTMPPQQLTDEEVAAVLTYVYGSFGNSGQTVAPEEVKAIRDKK